MRRPPAKREVLTVSQVSARVSSTLEKNFRDLWVKGEISELVRHSSGHWYFNLKDDKSGIRAVMFKFQNMYLRFKPEDGMEVVCRGKVTAYPPRSVYQLQVEWMEPLGLGALYVEFEKLKARLDKEGLFDPAKKKPVPSPLRKIAVITSPSGAALFDMLRVLGERDPGIEVLIVPSRVQGEGAAESLAAALDLVNEKSASGALGDPVEAVIIGRGGGSIEDLWAFNEEVLARAIFRSKIPVVSAVGHEVDYTIADFTADLRAPTPTAAAEMAAAGRAERIQLASHLAERMGGAMRRMVKDAELELRHLSARLRPPGRDIIERLIRLDELSSRMGRAVNSNLALNERDLSMTARRLAASHPQRSIRVLQKDLGKIESMLAASMGRRLGDFEHRLEKVEAGLFALSPRRTLKRGYAIVRDSGGRVVRCGGDVSVGDDVNVTLGRGGLDCEVTGVEEGE